MTGGTRGDAQGGGRPIPPAALRVASFNVRTGLGRTAGTAGRCGPARAQPPSPASTPTSSACRRCASSRSAGWRAGCPATPAPAPAATTAAAAASAAPSSTVPPVCGSRHWTVRWFSDTPWLPGLAVVGQPDPADRHPLPLRRPADRRRLRRSPTLHWDGASAVSRLRSAEALLGWLDPSLPWLVVGDLNATAARPGRRAPGRRRPARHARRARRPRPAGRDAPRLGRLDRRHPHRLRPRGRRAGTCWTPASTTRDPAGACRPTTGRWSPTSCCDGEA